MCRGVMQTRCVRATGVDADVPERASGTSARPIGRWPTALLARIEGCDSFTDRLHDARAPLVAFALAKATTRVASRRNHREEGRYPRTTFSRGSQTPACGDRTAVETSVTNGFKSAFLGHRLCKVMDEVNAGGILRPSR